MKASELKKTEWIPTPFHKLNMILGGGIPVGKITEISGQWSVGKSTLAMQILASIKDRDLLFADTEYSFEITHAENLGVNLDSLEVLQERLAEDTLDKIEEWVTKHKKGVVVLDSVGGLLTRQEAEKGSGEKTIGAQAKIIAGFCRRIVPLLSINQVSLIILNHEFTDLMSGRLTTSGGAKLAYHKSIWLRLRKLNKRVMKGSEQIGDVIQAEVRKNKLAPTKMQSCEMVLLYGKGFDADADSIEEAKDKLFEKRGQFWFWNEEKLARGDNALRELFKDSSFAAKVNESLGKS